MLIFKVSLHRLGGTTGYPIGGTTILIGRRGGGALMSDVICKRPFTYLSWHLLLYTAHDF